MCLAVCGSLSMCVHVCVCVTELEHMRSRPTAVQCTSTAVSHTRTHTHTRSLKWRSLRVCLASLAVFLFYSSCKCIMSCALLIFNFFIRVEIALNKCETTSATRLNKMPAEKYAMILQRITNASWKVCYDFIHCTHRDTTRGSQSPPQYLASTGSFVELPS